MRNKKMTESARQTRDHGGLSENKRTFQIIGVAALVGIMAVLGVFFLYSYFFGRTWTVTEYGGVNAKQSMFYTIKSDDDKVIVIDGGWKQSAASVRSVIYSLGGHVDYWILTHPHPDHVGAFNEIYKDPQGITIGQIYAVDINYNTYKKKAQARDGFSAFQTFYDLSQNMTNLTYVHEGDEFDLDGLLMNVYSTYNDTIGAESDDPCNDGSMVFKLSGRKKSILFMSDFAGNEDTCTAALMNAHGSELTADYVQAAHHGNSTLPDSFYENAKEQAVFIDSPKWLEEDTERRVPHLISVLDNKKIPFYTFENVPVVVEIQ
ncbi:MAG: MBL fold metallo-hydrolase [Eubacteriaceae bacterium]|nr:MBL fold metallo-hydrolase [Eubacteriaceae bacterium]MDD4508728.1 MBL fold metallo-hydrolase [Eubacteriaceae bacterium]